MSRSLAAALGLIAAGIGLAALAPPRGGCGEGYVVARGDTISHIARRCRSGVMAIARASGIANPDRIRVGQRLVIPHRERVAAAPAQGPRWRAAAAAQSGYRFARGDTLYSLARWAGVSVPALLTANPGINPRKIEIGDPVRLPAGAVSPGAARARERGPAASVPRHAPTAAPPRRERPAPPPPPDHDDEDKPDGEDEPDPMGM
ncbi:MAG TPA: LysM peptidoglycan-binding domain-containing protein [Allosphingosinicella sp.]|nr:LysM peptidoglycan-binding domain-containing protein [Allosphingosinicella sp.]